MDTLTWFFLESRVALLITGFLVNFFLLVAWRRGGSVRPLLVGLTLWLVLLATESLVVTQRETAGDTLTRIENDLLAGRVTALDASLAPGFSSENLDRRSFVETARVLLTRVRIMWCQRVELNVTPQDNNHFVVNAAYFSNISVDSYGGGVRSLWKLTFVRTPDGWRIERVDLPEIEGERMRSWSVPAR
ncbi:MAG: hypothetical protein U1D55_01295 [Phycisphaerae bacterium]